MQITPKQRRRAVRVHFLTLQGNSHKEIAESFKISRATVRADLQLIETHWSEIAAAAADDLLLESLQLLELRLSMANPDKTIDQQRQPPHARRVPARPGRPAKPSSPPSPEKSAAPSTRSISESSNAPTNPPSTKRKSRKPTKPATELTISATPKPTISSPEQEIVQSEPEKEKFPRRTRPRGPDQGSHHPLPPAQRPIRAQILQFLDQLTTPEPKIYAEAAG